MPTDQKNRDELISPEAFKRILRRSLKYPMILTLVLATVSISQALYLLRSSEWVDHTHQVIAQASLVKSSVLSADGALKGYLLTGKTRILEPFFSSENRYSQEVGVLEGLVSDDSAQMDHVVSMGKLVAEWLVAAHEAMQKRQFSRSVDLGEVENRFERVQKIREDLNRIIEIEDTKLAKRSAWVNCVLFSFVLSTLILALMVGGILALLARLQLKNLASNYEKAISETRHAVQMRDEFLSIASHELKTPLTSLILQMQLLRRSLVKGESATVDSNLKLVETSEKLSLKIGALIEDLLDLTRLRLGRLPLVKREINLASLVREVLERYQVEVQQKKIMLHLDLSETVLGIWDPVRIEQVVSNLISNAIKYGEGKPIHIHLKLDSAHQRTILSVKDQGMGIAPEMHQKIFERFERAVAPSKISGFGLGLYISKQIVEAHRGSISVKSELGNGSEFTVELPLKS